MRRRCHFRCGVEDRSAGAPSRARIPARRRRPLPTRSARRLCRMQLKASSWLEAPLAKEGPLLILAQAPWRSEEHTSELQSLMRISYAVFCLKKKIKYINQLNTYQLHAHT